MRNERPDPVIMLAQLPSHSPIEIDSILRDEAQYCVVHQTGSKLLADIHKHLLPSDNPSILISIARYGSNLEVSNALWERATTHTSASDSEILRLGLRRACVLNRLIPLRNYKGQFWDEKKIEWFISSLQLKSNEPDNSIEVNDFDFWEPQQEKRHAIWWDFVELLQNENLSFSILSDAISGKGAFSRLSESEHTSLLHYIASNPSLQSPASAYEAEGYEGWKKLETALYSLLDTRTQKLDFRSAVYDIIISLSPEFGHGDIVLPADHPASVPMRVLRNWQYPTMAEIFARGGKTDEMVSGKPDLMPIIAFATWPSEVPAGKAPNFFVYSADYVTHDLSLSQMLDGVKRDGNLFCLLAIWNRHVMLSDVKRAMLRNLIENTRGPISSFELIKIYENRLKIWAALVARAETKWDDFGPIPELSDIKWKIQLRKIFGTSTKHDDVVLEVAKAIDLDQRGSTLDITRRGANRIFGWLSLWIIGMVMVDQFFADGEGLNGLITFLQDSWSRQ